MQKFFILSKKNDLYFSISILSPPGFPFIARHTQSFNTERIKKNNTNTNFEAFDQITLYFKHQDIEEKKTATNPFQLLNNPSKLFKLDC